MANTTPEYRAGLFDGEGCVTFTIQTYPADSPPSSRTWEGCIRPMLSMGNTNMELLKVMQNAYGGNIVKLRKEIKRKQAWMWTIRKAEDIRAACADLLPYLIAKREQTEIMLSMIHTYRNDRGHRPMQDEERAIRREAYHRIRTLNHRGDGAYIRCRS